MHMIWILWIRNASNESWDDKQLLSLTEQRSANLYSGVQSSWRQKQFEKSLKRLKDISSKWDEEQKVLDEHTQILKTSVFNTAVVYEQQLANKWVSDP